MAGWLVTRSATDEDPQSGFRYDRTAVHEAMRAYRVEVMSWLPACLPGWLITVDDIPATAAESTPLCHARLKGDGGPVLSHLVPQELYDACVKAEAEMARRAA